jgi:hypothetical protein
MLSLPVILLLEGFSFVVLFGAVSLLKREGLSSRFAFEALIFTLVVSGLTALTGIQTHPVLFLVLIYLLAMRVRILVDLGNIFAKRGQFESADKFYNLADRLWPDATNHLILKVNQGTSLLQQKNLTKQLQCSVKSSSMPIMVILVSNTKLPHTTIWVSPISVKTWTRALQSLLMQL